MSDKKHIPASHSEKVFHYLLGNTLAASIINSTVWFAITFFVYLQTKSVLATGIIGGSYMILAASSGIWFGSIVDHHKKKSAMLFSSAASLTMYASAFALYQLAGLSAFRDITSPILWVFVLLLMIGVVIGNIRNIALPTLVTILVPEAKRDRANGLVGTVTGMAFLVTSVISGFLVALSGMFHALVLAIVVTAALLVHLFFTQIPEKRIVHLAGQPKKVDLKGTYKLVKGVPGLMALIIFATFNNFLGGVFMALLDAYGLSQVSVQTWGVVWGVISTGFIVGGLLISKRGLGHNPLKTLMLVNVIMWIVSCLFTVVPAFALLFAGLYAYMVLVPFAEAAEQTILQKVVPLERQGRVFGFAQSVEQAASPLMAFIIGPITQIIFIPFMTTGAGVDLIGSWFGTGQGRGIALVFTLAGIVGLVVTLVAFGSKYYRMLSEYYKNGNVKAESIPKPEDLAGLS